MIVLIIQEVKNCFEVSAPRTESKRLKISFRFRQTEYLIKERIQQDIVLCMLPKHHVSVATFETMDRTGFELTGRNTVSLDGKKSHNNQRRRTAKAGYDLAKNGGVTRLSYSMLVSRIVVVALLLIALTSPTVMMVEANPLHRLLMRKPKHKDDEKNHKKPEQVIDGNTASEMVDTDASAKQQQLGGDEEKQCVDPKTLQKERESLHKEVEDLTLKYQEAQEDVQRWKDIKEDLVHQMAKLQSQTDKDMYQVREELLQLRSLLEEKENEMRSKEHKWEQSINITNQLAEERVHETESLWKREMDIAKSNYLLEIQETQREATHQCQANIQEKLDQIVANVTANNTAVSGAAAPNSSTPPPHPQNYATLLGVERVKVQLLEDETKSLEAQLLEQKAAVQTLIDQLTGQYESKYHEKERELEHKLEKKMKELENNDACQMALDKATKKYEAQYTKTVELYDDAMNQLEHEQNLRLESIIAQQELERNITKLEKKISELKQQEIQDHEKAESDIQDLAKQHTAALQQLEEQQAATIAKLTEQHKTTAKQLKEKISGMQVEMETMQKQHELELEQAELKVRTELTSLMDKTTKEFRKEIETSQKHYDQVKTTLEKEISNAQDLLAQHQSTLEERNLQINKLTKELHAAKKDVEYWEHVFGKRSYFNLTHVQDDAVYWMGEGYREISSWWIQDVYEPVNRELEPYRQKTVSWYKRYLQKYWEPLYTVLHQNYQKHATPQLEKGRKYLQKAQTSLARQYQQMFDATVEEIRRRCPGISKDSVVKKWLPPLVQRKIQEQVCDTPDQALRQSIFTVAFVIVIVLRVQIWSCVIHIFAFFWRLVCRTIVGVVKLCWFLSPLRLLLKAIRPSSSADAEHQDGVDGDDDDLVGGKGRRNNGGVPIKNGHTKISKKL